MDLKYILMYDIAYAVTFAKNDRMYKTIDKIYRSEKETFDEVSKQYEYLYNRVLIAYCDYELIIKIRHVLPVIIVMAANPEITEAIFSAARVAYKPLWKEFEYAIHKKANNDKSVEYKKIANRGRFKDFDSISDLSIVALFFSGVTKIEFKINPENLQVALGYTSVDKNDTFKNLETEYNNVIGNKDELDFSTYVKEGFTLPKDIQDKYLMLATFIFNCYGSNVLMQHNIEMTKEDTDYVIMNISLFEKYFDIELNEQARDIAVIFGLMVAKHIKMHLKAKNFILDNIDTLEEYNDNIKAIKSENEKLSFENEELKKLVKTKQDKLNEIQIQNDKLKIENDSLKETINMLIEEQRNLIASKNNLKFESNINETKLKNEDKIKIAELKPLIFGGIDTWQDNVSKNFNVSKAISVSANNFDTSLIANYDLIIINYGYMSHAQYYKVINAARQNKKQVIYCTNNIDRLMQDLKYIERFN